MITVSVDFETRSTVNLKRTGVYPYARHPSTGIWLMAYAFGDEEPLLWHPGEPPDPRLADHILAGGPLAAWNAQFERTMWHYKMREFGWPVPLISQWWCTMARAACYGLPLHLETAAKALGIEQQKDMDGSRLMQQMCKPRRVEPDGTIVWWDAPEKIERLGVYCKQDVRTERAIGEQLRPMSDSERRIYLLDQQINDRGVGLDVPLAEAALDVAERALVKANEQISSLTDGDVPAVSAVAAMAGWLHRQGVSCDGVNKQEVASMKARPSLAPAVREVLQIREEAGKSSVAKYESMLEYGREDGRMRGLLAYHGAATGRWAGRGPQPQNFPRGTVKNPESFIPIVLRRDLDLLSLIDAPLAVLSSMLRSVMRAAPGHRLIAGDYAAIEARVLAWLAGHEDLLEDFRHGVDVYKGLAAQIYDVPVAEVDKGQRLMGKIAVLGLGYSMGWAKFIESCAKFGVTISEEFSKGVVSVYRMANEPIVALWHSLENAALHAVENEGAIIAATGRVRFQRRGAWLYMQLPSGRTLKYREPIIVQKETPWGAVKDTVQFKGFNSVTRQWGPAYLYGGLLAENLTQATARDILAEAMLRLDAAGYPIVLTVHDEIVAEVPEGPPQTAEEFESLMTVVPDWAIGCPIKAEVWEGPRYRK